VPNRGEKTSRLSFYVATMLVIYPKEASYEEEKRTLSKLEYLAKREDDHEKTRIVSLSRVNENGKEEICRPTHIGD